MTFRLSKNFHGVGIGPLSKILAVKSRFPPKVDTKVENSTTEAHICWHTVSGPVLDCHHQPIRFNWTRMKWQKNGGDVMDFSSYDPRAANWRFEAKIMGPLNH